MIKNIKKTISVLLAIVMVSALLPTMKFGAEAAQTESETPILNRTIVGTVQFQSFNFLGDNASGSDGVDYTSTFYYTDDFFSPSAIHETNTASLKWSDMTENELSLAATSFDFTVAAYASNEKNVLTATSRSWDNTYYPGKDKNARAMLETCGFSDFESYSTYDQAPTNDSIGYVIASKRITVWDEPSESNKEFTLIAVGVRGAGYGAEWASNITIGDTATNQLPDNGRHWGFDDAAKKVCNGIQNYLDTHHISSDVKYWISGFSRAGATANLVAGYVTDEAESTYHTRQRDVFGFTWECPQGASTSENALNYKNIHNILNPMDAVPKVSPDAFEHQRLGVDYAMPYYGNTTSSENTDYYTRMREVLKTIATGAYNYKGEAYTEDPLIEVTDPANYPYNRPMTIYTITPTQMISDAINDKLMDNFGTSAVSGSNNKLGTNIYIDRFIDNLIDVFLQSKAWVGEIGGTRTALQNRTTFISNYQNDFRNVLGYLLDYSGPAFLGMVDALVDAVGDQLSISNTVTNAGLGLAFLNFYEYPTSTYKWGVPPFIDPWVGSPSWAGQTRRAVLISEAQPVVKNVIRNMVGGFVDPQGITRAQFENSMDHLVELVVNLYADELSKYNSNYFGTTLHYMWQILCTHEQEVVMSWIKSLDPNHMNRSCRTLTIPSDTDVTLYEFRSWYGEEPTDTDTTAPVVATWSGGELDSKDDRITFTQSGDSVIIRYPASLEIRADVTANESLDLTDIQVSDYQTKNDYTKVSDGEDQFSDKLPSASYTNITSTNKTNAAAKNRDLNNYGVSLSKGDTLHVLVNDMEAYNSSDTEYELSIDKAAVSTIVSYTTADAGLATGTDADGAVRLGVDSTLEQTTDTTRSIKTRQTKIVVPASNVYYDDELIHSNIADYAGNTTRLDQDDQGTILWYRFRGTRIDVYCTTDSTTGYVMAAVYENNDGEPGERVGLMTMKSSSETPHYNVPTISFDGLTANKDYYLRLFAVRGSNYRLDGIRVYHSANENDTTVKTAYEAAGEQNAKYVNLRKMLLGSISEDSLSGNVEEGALFYTDQGSSYALTSDEYQANSPKNEIYLDQGQSVAFQIVGTYEKVAVGISAPDSRTGGGSVTVTDGNGSKTQPIANALDQYYTICPASDGSVVIRNTGSAMIAITNVKLSGTYTAPAGSSNTLNTAGPLRVSKALLQYAADFDSAGTTVVELEEPQETASPAPEPSPAIASRIRSLIAEISRKMAKLFGRVVR